MAGTGPAAAGWVILLSSVDVPLQPTAVVFHPASAHRSGQERWDNLESPSHMAGDMA
jgi:hypothetical protein